MIIEEKVVNMREWMVRRIIIVANVVVSGTTQKFA